MCFKGTKKYPTSTDVSTVIEGVGGILNAGTDKELTIYWCKVADVHFHSALDVLTDILIHSKFDPAEMRKSARSLSKRSICRWTLRRSVFPCSSMT